jgi:polyisoprenoid-binding protein YceI
MDGDLLVGGMFVVDMTSINVTDLEAGKGKEKLEGHLKSADFFGIEKYPTATLFINKATKDGNTYDVNANITIKGTTESINFELEMGKSAATTSFKIDRTKFGIRYGSGSFGDDLGDKAISDKFLLDVNLKF